MNFLCNRRTANNQKNILVKPVDASEFYVNLPGNRNHEMINSTKCNVSTITGPQTGRYR